MELQVFSATLNFETLSGRRLNVEQYERNETYGSVKRRIASMYENDGEIGSDGFYLLHSGKELNDDEIVNESLINENNNNSTTANAGTRNIQIRRKRYSCFAEHMIKEHLTNKYYQWISRVLCICVSMLMIAGLAQVSFYLPHAKSVPVTFQTLGVFVISSLLGWKMGVTSIVLYLFCGLVGAPFFSNQNHGIAYLHGSTSGYLYGFLVAAFLVGYSSELGSDRVYFFNWKSTLLSMVLGNIVIYIVGIPVLSIKIGWIAAFKFGLLPFLVGDLLKIIIATIIIPSIWKTVAFISNKHIIIKSQIPFDFLSTNNN